MAQHVLVTGGTGFIGQALCPLLLQAGYRVTVLSRQTSAQVERLCGSAVKSIQLVEQIEHLSPIDAIINLAGESVMDEAWSDDRKQTLRNSRIALTQAMLQQVSKLQHKPALLISGSAIGYYGNGGNNVLNESAPAGSDFSAQLCADWERAARGFEALGIRVCYLRIGVVLAPDGAALSRMALPTRYGLGAVLGNGKQWMAWIDRSDLCQLMLFLLKHPRAQGPINAVAPVPVTHKEFMKTLAKVLRRPLLGKAPAFLLRLALGERASLLLDSQRVIPAAAEALGFRFAHPTLLSALVTYYGGSR